MRRPQNEQVTKKLLPLQPRQPLPGIVDFRQARVGVLYHASLGIWLYARRTDKLNVPFSFRGYFFHRVRVP